MLATIRADSVQSLLVRVTELGLETPKVLYLPPLPPAAYREVVLRPAEIYPERVRRLTIEPALAQALVQDATGTDALPLLAFSLGRLFTDYAAEGELTPAQYRQMGGASGSIARALKEAQSLAEARLLSRSADVVEVAHEALLRRPPVSDWLAEDRDFLMWRDRLDRASAQFDANERGLLVGRELQIACDWLNTRAADAARPTAPSSRPAPRRTTGGAAPRSSAEEQRERQVVELTALRRLVRRTVAGLAASLVLALLAGGAWFQAPKSYSLRGILMSCRVWL